MGADWFESYLVDYDVASNWGCLGSNRRRKLQVRFFCVKVSDKTELRRQRCDLQCRSYHTVHYRKGARIKVCVILACPCISSGTRKLGSCSGHDDGTYQPVQCTMATAGPCWAPFRVRNVRSPGSRRPMTRPGSMIAPIGMLLPQPGKTFLSV